MKATEMETSNWVVFSLLWFVALSTASAQNRLPAFEMNEKLGRGINMGNTFEAPSEAEWGNPWKPEYFRIIHELGFNHVRLPVRWEPTARSQAVAPYTINPDFLDRIQLVIDSAIRNNLHIIVNMHHHEALFEDPAGQKERFLSQWNQIATRFKDYPDNLLFEVLNEPHGNVSPAIWNELFAGALAEIRKTNPTRVLILGVAEYGGLGAIFQLELPDDEYIILSPHYYNPFEFTHQGADWVVGADAWKGTKWNDTEADRATVENEFKYALEFSEANHIPVYVGEFGAINLADMDSRARWTTFLGRWFEEHNLSWAYWEFSAGFGIYDPATKTYVTPLVDALLNNEMPEPTQVHATPRYTSNFSLGTDGWTLNTQGGAAGSVATADGQLQVSLTSGGTESWHAQLVKNDILLEKGKLYRVSFKAKAASDRSAAAYVGRASDPWTAYSGISGFNAGTTLSSYSFNFTMMDATDPSARIVFDLGKNTIAFFLTEVVVEELTIGSNSEPEPGTDPGTVTSVENRALEVHVYPNPVGHILYMSGTQLPREVELFDVAGKSWTLHTSQSFTGELAQATNQQIIKSTNELDLQQLPGGLYILKWVTDGQERRMKIVKR